MSPKPIEAALSPKRTSARGVHFIAGWEGLSLTPYNDAAGHATIGYGHLLHRGNVTEHDRTMSRGFTCDRALDLLRGDLDAAEAAVNELVEPPFAFQHRYDALVSFVFNVGAGAFTTSRLRARLNATRSRRGAADELLRWIYAGGQPLPGLLNRRRAERRLFLYRFYG